MTDSNAVRVARSKKHKKDDHSLCVVGRCLDITPKDRVNALGPQGRSVWDAVIKHDTLTAIQRMILLEFCRNVDRLDVLNQVITGSPSFIDLVTKDDEPIATVVVNGALGEARQIQAVMKQQAAELRLSGLTGGLGEGKRPPGRPPTETGQPASPDQTEGGTGDAHTGNVVAIASRIAAIRGGQAPN